MLPNSWTFLELIGMGLPVKRITGLPGELIIIEGLRRFIVF
jgi:hypothetical protein